MLKLRPTVAIVMLSALVVLQSVVARSEPSDILGSVQMEPGTLLEDPLRLLNTRTPNGVLTYSFPVAYGNGIAVRFFQDGKQRVMNFVLKFTDWEKYSAFDCKRSPDGRYIAFKYGTDYSDYKLCILDTQAKMLRIVSENFLSFRDFSFSPDSKYIAFVEGGNYRGMTNTPEAKPLELLCYNVAKDETKVVPAKGFVPTSLSWLPPHSLYFSAQSDTTEMTASRKKPDLCQLDPVTSKVSWVMKDCYRPVFSLDGKKLAFFGSENSDKPFPLIESWQHRADYMALCVSNLDGSERIVLTVEKGIYPTIVWSGLSTALYELKQDETSPQAALAFTKWNILSRKKEEILSLRTKDYKPMQRDETGSSPTFSLVGKGEKDEMLIAVIEVTEGDPKSPILNILQTLQVIDPLNKSIVPITSTSKSMSYHWQSN